MRQRGSLDPLGKRGQRFWKAAAQEGIQTDEYELW
jgi:hypothetical protein